MRVLAAGAEETVHDGLALGADDPAAIGAEAEFGEFGLCADSVDGGEQCRRIDAVHGNGNALLPGSLHDSGHPLFPSVEDLAGPADMPGRWSVP